MTIKELNANTKGVQIKKMLIEVDYNEMRDISNALYHLCEHEKESSDYDNLTIKNTARDALIAFDIIKHGTVTQFTIDKYSERCCPSDCKGVVESDV